MNDSTTYGRTDFFTAGGTLHYDAPSYVKRPADEELFELARTGHFCYVLTPRQMGKSSLMVRTSRRLQSQGIRTAIVDLTSIGTEVSAEQWYLGLINRLVTRLRLRLDVEAWWTEHTSIGVVQRFSDFIRQEILGNIDSQIVIFVDEIDTTLNLPFTDDFFAAVRAFYNARADDPLYDRLSFVLLGVATPADLIKDRTRTPFNIGRRIELKEFSFEDAHVLRQAMTQYFPQEGKVIFDRIYEWTSGHPYLTQRLCLAAVEQPKMEDGLAWVDGEVNSLFLSEAGARETNLQFIRDYIQRFPPDRQRQLLDIYSQVHKGKQIATDDRSLAQNQLKLLGLVKDESGFLVVSNKIYHHVFDREWIKATRPADRWRQAAIGAAVIAVIAIILGFYFLRQTQQQPDEVLAQSYVSNFNQTTNPTLRLDNLANILTLGGYEDQALEMFQSLSPDEQIAMFENVTPDLTTQLNEVIQGTYSSLFTDNFQRDQDSSRVLQSMVAALDNSSTPESRLLKQEINIWLGGRSFAVQENYEAARIRYDFAIEINDENPATFFERALASMRMEAYDDAIADLDVVWSRGAAWEEVVKDTVNGNVRFQEAIWASNKKPTFIAVVATLIPTQTPVPTLQPTNATEPSTTPAVVRQGPESSPTTAPSSTSALTSTAASTPTAAILATSTPVNTPTQVPVAVVNQQSGELKNPISFAWSGPSGVRYRVVMRHVVEGFNHTSGWLSAFSWSFSIPDEEFGGWTWYVETESGERSSTDDFVFNPHTGGGGGSTGQPPLPPPPSGPTTAPRLTPTP